eukprot:6198794-Pleurochrysis_carterae.AAC.2
MSTDCARATSEEPSPPTVDRTSSARPSLRHGARSDGESAPFLPSKQGLETKYSAEITMARAQGRVLERARS